MTTLPEQELEALPDGVVIVDDENVGHVLGLGLQVRSHESRREEEILRSVEIYVELGTAPKRIALSEAIFAGERYPPAVGRDQLLDDRQPQSRALCLV